MAGLVRNQLDNDVRPLNALVPDEINAIPGFINGPRPIGPSMRYPCMPGASVDYPMPGVFARPAPTVSPAPSPSSSSSMMMMQTLPPETTVLGGDKVKSEGGAKKMASYVVHCERVVRGQEPVCCGDWLVLLMLVLMVYFRQYWALALIFFFATLSHNGHL